MISHYTVLYCIINNSVQPLSLLYSALTTIVLDRVCLGFSLALSLFPSLTLTLYTTITVLNRQCPKLQPPSLSLAMYKVPLI